MISTLHKPRCSPSKWVGFAALSLHIMLGGCSSPKEKVSGGQASVVSQVGSERRTEAGPVEVSGHEPAATHSPPSPSEACEDCHPDHVSDYKETGMGRSLYRPKNAVKIEHFGDARARVIHPLTKVSYRAYIDASGRWWQEESVNGSDYQRRVEVAYIIGSGNQTRSYLGWVEGELVQMPLTWYSAKKKWDLSPGYDRADHPRFSRKVQPPCLFCHNDLSAHQPETVAQYKQPLAEGISCTRCHGDGQAHVAMRQSGGGPAQGEADETILNPARLSTERQLEICQQCHLAGVTRVLERGHSWDNYDPRTPLRNYMAIYAFEGDNGDDFGIAGQAQRLNMSRCAQESPKGLTCTQCHNPHKRDKAFARRAACLECHKANDCGSEHGLSVDSQCSECHMNRGETRDIPHVNYTDHYIRKKARFSRRNLDYGRSHELVELLKAPLDDQGLIDQQLRRGLAHYEVWKARGGRIHLGFAERFLSKALIAMPDYTHAWDVLGRTRSGLGDYDGAVLAFAQVERQRPTFVDDI